MKYMLDTNICIFVIKNKNTNVLQKFRKNMKKGLCISSITYAELMFGIYNSDNFDKNLQNLTDFISFIKILPFDSSACDEYGEIKAYLKKQGTPIGPMDTLIAAHAKSQKLTLVTNNIKEFNRVQDLKIEDWV